jgi:cyclopropane-fatty-acyl-phospholipid synthase
MHRVLELYLRSLIKQGSLTVDMPGGRAFFGDATGPDLAIKITDKSAVRALLMNPVLKFGELYMDHRIEVTQGSLRDILFLASRNILHSGAMDWTRIIDHLRNLATKLDMGNTLSRSRANVAHHYDLDRQLYALFLDQDWQYSCGYFENPDDSLDAAQLAKKRHIAKIACRLNSRITGTRKDPSIAWSPSECSNMSA